MNTASVEEFIFAVCIDFVEGAFSFQAERVNFLLLNRKRHVIITVDIFDCPSFLQLFYRLDSRDDKKFFDKFRLLLLSALSCILRAPSMLWQVK